MHRGIRSRFGTAAASERLRPRLTQQLAVLEFVM
jgi:hypothetical protein